MPLPSDQSMGDSAGPTERLATAQDASYFETQPSAGTQLSPPAQQEIPFRPGTKHIQFIDSLRGLAALSIIAFHLYFVPTTQFALSDGLLSCIKRLGLGVPLFFMISGLTLSLSESRTKRSNFLAFLAKRFFRIYPLYLVVLSLMLALGAFYWHSNFPSWSELLLDISLLFNFFPGHVEGLVWASWSLSVEIIFYLFFPFVFARLRSGYRGKIKFLLSALVLSALAKLFIIPMIAPLSGEVDKFSYFSIFNQLPFFAVGICLYGYLFENAPKRLPGQAKSSAVWFALFILLCSASQSFWMNAIYLQGIGLACLILSMACTQKHLLVNPITVYLGKISYSLYLLHVFVIVFIFPSIRDFTSGLLPLPGDVWYLIHLFLVVSITAAIATATYYWLELPFVRLGGQIAHQISSSKIEQPLPAPKTSPVSGKLLRFAPPLSILLIAVILVSWRMSALRTKPLQGGNQDLPGEQALRTVQLLQASQAPFSVEEAKPAADGPWIETLAIDGRPLDLHSTSKVVEAVAGSHLEIAGWMADTVHPIDKAPVFVGLLSGDNWKSGRLLSTKLVERPDVARYFHKRELEQSGFQVDGLVPEALAGKIWRLVLFSVGQKGPVRVDSEWRLSVRH